LLGIFESKVGRLVFFASIFKSRLCQVPYCVRVLKTSRRWGQVGVQRCVIYDMKSRVGFITLLLSICFLCLKTIVVNAKGSDFNSHSENVVFMPEN